MTPEDQLNPDSFMASRAPVVSRKPKRVVGEEKLQGVQPELLDHWGNLQSQFEAAGVTPIIKSGFRTAEQQNYLHTHGFPTMGNDGYKKISPHQDGRALDVGFPAGQQAIGRRILTNYARTNNLVIPPGEPWHIAIPKASSTHDSEPLSDVDAFMAERQSAKAAPLSDVDAFMQERARQKAVTPSQPQVSGTGTVADPLNLPAGTYDLTNDGPRPQVLKQGSGAATVRDDVDFSQEIKAQGDELARTNKPEGKAIDISRGDLLPDGGVRVSIPVLPDDDAQSLLARGVHATATHLGLRGADVELATHEALDYLRSQNINGAVRNDSNAPISKEELDAYKLKGVTTFDLAHPGLKPIFDKYVEQGKTGAGSGQTPQELNNSRQLRKEVARMPPVMQGMVGGFYGVDHDIGNALSATGLADENFTKDADKGAQLVAQTIQESPNQSFGANLGRAVGEAVPTTNELLSLQETRAAMPIIGALKNADKGKMAALKGAAEGAAMQGAMHLTPGLGIGRAGNAALWTAVPTVQAINQGVSPSKALAGALPLGAMAGMGGERAVEKPESLGRIETESAPIAEKSPQTETIVLHSNSEIDGGRVISKKANGDLIVENKDNPEIKHIVRNPRVAGNREATIVRQPVQGQEKQAATSTEVMPTAEIKSQAVAPENTTRKESVNEVVPTREAEQKGEVAASPEISESAKQEVKKWFGESKVVDEKGEPLVVYHGSKEKWDVFDESRLNESQQIDRSMAKDAGSAIYLTSSEGHAAKFGDPHPFHVKMKNPLVYDAESAAERFWQEEEPDMDFRDFVLSRGGAYDVLGSADEIFWDRIRSAKRAGKDGVIVDFGDMPMSEARPDTPMGKVIIAFKPEQVRSVMGERIDTKATTTPEISTTGAKNEVTDAERAVRGLDPVQKQAAQTLGQAYHEGRSAVDEGRVDPRSLAQSIAEKPRPLTSKEVGALGYDRARLVNEHRQAVEEVAKAVDAKDDLAIADGRARLARVENDLDRNDQALQKGGREQAAAFNARKMIVRDDYSLASLVQRAKALSGAEISQEARAKLETLSRQLEDATAKVDAHEETIKKLQAERVVKQMARQEGLRSRQKSRATTKVELDDEFAALRAQLAKARTSNTGIQPSGLAGLDPEGELTKLVAKMARNRVRAGINTVEGVVDEVHAALVDHFDNLTKRDVRDAISQYGVTQEMSKDEVSKNLRDLKRQMKLVSAIEDARGGQQPLKSGMAREPESLKVISLRRQLNDLMKQSGMKSAREMSDEAKVKMRAGALAKEIADLDRRIKAKDFSRASAKPPPSTPELEALKTQRNELKQQYDALKPTTPTRSMSDASKIKMRQGSLEKQIADLDRRIKQGDFSRVASTPTPSTPVLDNLKAQRDALKQQYDALKPESAPRTLSDQAKIRMQKGALERRIADLDRRIKQNDFSRPKGRLTPTTPELENLKARRAELQKEYDAVKPEVMRDPLPAIKSRLQKHIAELEGKIEVGDFTKPAPRAKVVYDKDAAELRARRDTLKAKIDNELAKQKKVSPTDYLLKWRRTVLLSSVPTIGKLAAAAGYRNITTPIEEIIGGGISKLMPKLAAKAPREGGFNPQAEAAALRQFVEKATYTDMLQKLKTGKGALDVQFGKKVVERDHPVLEFFGHLHGALKTQPMRAEFFRSLEKRSAHAARNGADLTDPQVQLGLSTQAYADSQRAILMNDNLITDAYKNTLQSLERSGALGKALATGGRIILPIVKVPTNYVAEASSHLPGIGAAKGVARIIASRGIENLTPEQADYVMRAFKKQGIGLALTAIGYYGASNVGGYYQQGEKRDEKDVQASEFKVFGVTVPHTLAHSPALEALQFGATVRRVSDKLRAKGKPDDREAVYQGVKGLVEQTPFIQTPLNAGRTFADSGSASRAAGELVKGMIIPPDVQKIAKRMDTGASGDVVKRKPQGFVDTVESGVPVLRRRVPIDKTFGTEATKASDELQRLRMGIGETKMGRGEPVKDFQSRAQIVNDEIRKALNELVDSADYRRAKDDDERKQLMRETITEVRRDNKFEQ